MKTVSDLYTATARRADTPKQKINVADVSRVGNAMAQVLCELPEAQAFALLGKWLGAARKKRSR